MKNENLKMKKRNSSFKQEWSLLKDYLGFIKHLPFLLMLVCLSWILLLCISLPNMEDEFDIIIII